MVSTHLVRRYTNLIYLTTTGFTRAREAAYSYFGEFFYERVARQTDKSFQRQTELVSTQRTLYDVTSVLVHSDTFQTRQTERMNARQLARTGVNLQ